MDYDLYFTEYKGQTYTVNEVRHDSFEGRPYTVTNVYKLVDTAKEDNGKTVYHYKLDRSA